MFDNYSGRKKRNQDGLDAVYTMEQEQIQKQKEKELKEVNDKLSLAQRVNKPKVLNEWQWRPAWTTSQLVVMVNVLYNQRNILSKTISKICMKWPERQDVLEEEGFYWLDKANKNNMFLPEVDNMMEPYWKGNNVPNYKDFNKGISENELLQFPFKDRVNERKKQRGIK